MLQEGYDQFRDAGIFKVPETGPWRLFVTSPELIDELRKAPDDELSFAAATNEVRPSFRAKRNDESTSKV